MNHENLRGSSAMVQSDHVDGLRLEGYVRPGSRWASSPRAEWAPRSAPYWNVPTTSSSRAVPCRPRRGGAPPVDCRTRLVRPVDEVAANAELLILAVPDAELAHLVSGLAATAAVKPGTIVAHTSGRQRHRHPRPAGRLGCVPLAIHPGDDVHRCRRGHRPTDRTPASVITAADEIGYAIAQSLVLEIGGEPFRVREDARTLVPRCPRARIQPRRHRRRRCALEALRSALWGAELLGQETGRRRTGRDRRTRHRATGPRSTGEHPCSAGRPR